MKRLLPFLFLLPTVIMAQSQTGTVLTPEQLANVLKQIDQIETQVSKNRTDSLGAANSQLRAAATNEKAAVELYLSCSKLVNFDRRNLKTTDFQAWKDQQADFLQHPEFASALRLQVEYLLLSLQAHQQDDLAPVIPVLQGYIGRAITAVQSATKHTASGVVESTAEADPNKKGGPRGGLPRGPAAVTLRVLLQDNQQPADVRQSVFSRAFQLDSYLTRKDWEYIPLNIGGIYTKIIFPYYLENKPAELAVRWDERINAEMALAKARQNENEFQITYALQQPRLQWAKAQNLFSNNINGVQALADMLKIIRDNPTHPNASEWVTELRQSVNASQPAAVSPSAAEAGAAPAAALGK